MALHEQSVGKSDEWYTPRHVFEAMGTTFDLDVASPQTDCPADDFCETMLCARALETPWWGFVWMNPPFGARNGLVPWLDKFFEHGNGVALVPDRTSAPWWQDYAPKAEAVLFVRKKLRFIRPDGSEGASPAQGTTLMAIGWQGRSALERAAAAGLGLMLFNRPEGVATTPDDTREASKPKARATEPKDLLDSQTTGGGA